MKPRVTVYFTVSRICCRKTPLWVATRRTFAFRVPIRSVLWAGTGMRWCPGCSVWRMMRLPGQLHGTTSSW